MAEHNQIGTIGERLAKTFLMKQGFLIIETNYRTRYGEIDIIAKKDNDIHFVEVKSIKVRSFSSLETVSIRPEDNLTHSKWSKLEISCETYIEHHKLQNSNFQIDLACVYVDTELRQGKVRLLENIRKE